METAGRARHSAPLVSSPSLSKPPNPEACCCWVLARRRSDNAASAHAFGAINRMFSNDDMLATLLRGPMLGLAGRMPPLARALWRHAAGI